MLMAFTQGSRSVGIRMQQIKSLSYALFPVLLSYCSGKRDAMEPFQIEMINNRTLLYTPSTSIGCLMVWISLWCFLHKAVVVVYSLLGCLWTSYGVDCV